MFMNSRPRLRSLSPLVHVVLGVVQPHPDLDGVALADPVENVLHLGLELDAQLDFKVYIINT